MEREREEAKFEEEEEEQSYFTVRVKGQEDGGYYVMITEGPFESFEEAKTYATNLLEEARMEEGVEVRGLVWH